MKIIILLLAQLFASMAFASTPSETLIKLKQTITNPKFFQNTLSSDLNHQFYSPNQPFHSPITMNTQSYDIFGKTPKMGIYNYYQPAYSVTYSNLTKSQCTQLTTSLTSSKPDAVFTGSPVPTFPHKQSICYLTLPPTIHNHATSITINPQMCHLPSQSITIIYSTTRTGFPGCSINY